MHSDTKDIDGYLEHMDDRWRPVVTEVRERLKAVLPAGYDETFRWNMISYEVPIAISGPTYNGQPLLFAALAAQKHHVSLYLMALYAEQSLARTVEEAFVRMGRKPDMGKSCIRFKRVEDIPLQEILALLESITVDRFLASMKHSSRGSTSTRG